MGRLSIYLRILEKLSFAEFISSFQLAKEAGVNPAQVRKDLAYFGQFGRRKIGYKTRELSKNLKKILGVDRTWDVVLVGVGNLGSALLGYLRFRKEGFNICAAFDNDPAKIGKKFNGIEVKDIKEIEDFLKRRKVKIGIIAVPPEEAQEIAEILIKNGIEAILNFSSASISVPKTAKVTNIDFTSGLENLTFYLTHK